MFGYGDFGDDGKKRSENGWKGCSVERKKNEEKKNGRIQLFFLQAHQKMISPNWVENRREYVRLMLDEIVLGSP